MRAKCTGLLESWREETLLLLQPLIGGSELPGARLDGPRSPLDLVRAAAERFVRGSSGFSLGFVTVTAGAWL